MSFKHTLNNTLEYLIKKWGVNINQLHKHTGIPLSTLKRLRLNKENNPTLASLAPIANYFSVSLDQLIGREALPKKNNKKLSGLTLPLIHWKDILDTPKNRYYLAFSSLLIRDISLNENSYGLVIKDKNTNNFLAGSLLVIDPSLKGRNRDFIIVHKKGMSKPKLMQKIIYENKAYLKNLNNNSEIIKFSDLYKILGVVIQIRMNYKKSKFYVNFEDEKSNGATKY
ncbi:helix-turn-helix transcriptional regulator [Rickettsiella endosymbiont of Miltochrista miniata]|uniref:helix-turn-helix domain-containing protein n=1 Tax=Rickettsiella endosymbiont of Miltochrista miniata TaxID=3066239 RepID=UPI00313BC42E